MDIGYVFEYTVTKERLQILHSEKYTRASEMITLLYSPTVRRLEYSEYTFEEKEKVLLEEYTAMSNFLKKVRGSGRTYANRVAVPFEVYEDLLKP